MVATTEFNIKRLEYLLALYGMSKEQLLSILNDGRKKLLSLDDINGPKIKLSILKKIDGIFKKGLQFYLDFADLKINREAKVFFRKNTFHSDLTIADKQIVDSFESLKSLLDGYRALTETTNTEYCLKGVANIRLPAKEVANQYRSQLLPEKKISDHKDFLRAVIEKLANLNVYVFEFVESWNKRNKASIDGFYLDPNVIVLKRQRSYKREIFTLAHEIGHYLLGIEDVEALDMSDVDLNRIHNKVERWCNDFAFYLIAGEAVEVLNKFKGFSADLEEAIQLLSETTHISRMAWYTKLAYEKIVPMSYYRSMIRSLKEESEKFRQERNEELKLKNLSAFSAPRPIVSPLYLETMQYAFYNGLISEASFCEQLKIPQNKLDKYL